MKTAATPQKLKRKRTDGSQPSFPLFRQPSFARQIGAVASPSAPEKKNIDTNNTLVGGATSTWSQVFLINPIPQGASSNQRIGRRCTLTSMLIRWNLSGASAGLARLLVIYDHAPNGALPLITDILTLNLFNAPMNLINNDRFMVLHDEIAISPNAAAANTMAGKWNYKRQPLQNQWTNAATGTIADITTGAVYFIACAPGVIVGVDFVARVRFTDL